MAYYNKEEQTALTRRAKAAGIDPDDYDSWADLEETLDSQDKLISRLTRFSYCRLAPSIIVPGGVGVFAVRDIPKGIKVFQDIITCEWVGFSEAELKKRLPKPLPDMVKEFFALDDDDGLRYIPVTGFNNLTLDSYINHRKDDPNIVPDESNDDFVFVSLRDIKTGEELCYDYSRYPSLYNPEWDK